MRRGAVYTGEAIFGFINRVVGASMATRTDAKHLPSTIAKPTWVNRFVTWLPWLGIALWGVGFVGIWYLGQQQNWSPGLFVGASCGWLAVAAIVARDAVRNMFGPVFLYEVVRLGRKRSTFVYRALYVVGVMAVFCFQYMVWLEEVGYFRNSSMDRIPSERLSKFATEFFLVFTVIQFCVVAFLTPAYVAGCIADEKEKKTLEFLLATDLRGHEIIFGKLAARIVNLLMYVMAGLPVVAFMQLFGGIDIDLLIASTTITVITVIGLAAVSIYFSTTLKRPRDAIALSYMMIAVYAIVTAMLAFFVRNVLVTMPVAPITVLNYTINTSEVIDWLAEATDWLAAGNVLYVIPRLLFSGLFSGFSTAALITAMFRYALFWGLVSVVTLSYSVLRLRAIALRQSYGAAKVVTKRQAKQRPVLGDDPMFWKEVFVDSGVRGGCAGWVMSILIMVLVFSIPIIILLFHFGDLIPLVNLLIDFPVTGQTMHTRIHDFQLGINMWVRIATGTIGALTLLAATVRGSAAVSGERDRDTWISLIATPLTAWEMVRGKWLGCVLGLRKAYSIILLIWAIGLLCGAVDPPMIVVTAIYFTIYISAFAWLGILCSISARTTMIATIRAMMIALFIGGGHWLFIMLCCMMPISLIARGSGLEVIESFLFLLLGCTPPFMLGWLPIHEYSRWELRVFEWNSSQNLFGPLSPIFGGLFWLGLSGFLALLSWQGFRRISNRDHDALSERLAELRQKKPPVSDKEVASKG